MSTFRQKFFNLKSILFVLFAIFPIAVSMCYYANQYIDKSKSYIVTFNENVSGLEVGSPVLLNGVNIGFIKKISVDSISDAVNIVIFISKTINVENKIAQIESQGFTGHRYVNLVYVDNRGKMEMKNNYLQIPSKKSGMSQIFNKAPMIADQSSNLVKKLNSIDIDSVNKILSNLAEASEKMNKILNTVEFSLQGNKSHLHDFFSTSMPELNASIHNLNSLLDDSSKIMKRFKEKPVKFLLDWYS